VTDYRRAVKIKNMKGVPSEERCEELIQNIKRCYRLEAMREHRMMGTVI
jgi:hypothetical protein